MRQQQKVKEKFLQEIYTLKEKIQEVEELAGKNSNGVQLEDLIRRIRKALANCDDKIKNIQKMASKK